jgi:hypothetical protein
LAPGGTDSPQAGQPLTMAVPHSLQNLALAGWSAPQPEHVVTSTPR